MKKIVTSISLLILLFFCTDFRAQSIFQTSTADSIIVEQETEIDPLGRSTPSGSVDGFLNSIADKDYLKASQYINYPSTYETKNDSLLAVQVKRIELLLNKHGKIDPVRIINNSTEGDKNDGLNESLEKVGTLDLDNKSIPILLESVAIDKPYNIWLISRETTDYMMGFLDKNNNNYQINNNVSGAEYNWFGAQLVDWMAMVLLAILAYMAAWLFTLLLKFLIKLFWQNFRTSKYNRFLRTLLIPLRLVLAVFILLSISRYLGISIVVRQAFGVVNLMAMWTALFIFIWLLIDAISSMADEQLRERNIFSGLSAISFLKNSAKFTLIVISVLIIFETLGYNITAGIAALGVGGIALALGAQKTVENIVGGLSVVFDQPVSVGDFCRFGDTLGTVEKIGMRSTRIRTLGRTIVSIPNADFSSQIIENFAKRDLFLFQTNIGLRYETSTNQMRFILVELRKILYSHPKVDSDPARVRFIGYGNDALNVEIFAYCKAKDWNDYLGIQEDINLRIGEVVEASGTGFAFPSQTIYLSKDSGLSNAKKEAAERKVQEWAKNNDLNLPEFNQKTIASLKDSLEYPQNPFNDDNLKDDFKNNN